VSEVMELDRELPSCPGCGSTVRWRSIIRTLSLELFGESLALPDFPHRPDIRGLGMSDWDGYAQTLSRKFDYVNTYYHREPKFDITNIPASFVGSFDFVISSDVFEHVPPPVSLAFANVRRLLKPGGVLIFTAPYTKEAETVEHFPELYNYELVETGDCFILKNTTRTGDSQVFENLIFHGGDGSTLEMRVFSERSLIGEFERAGFKNITIHGEPDFEHGIYRQEDWSLPMSARVPVDVV
jgi:SAM-dependent methyltransferase